LKDGVFSGNIFSLFLFLKNLEIYGFKVKIHDLKSTIILNKTNYDSQFGRGLPKLFITTHLKTKYLMVEIIAKNSNELILQVTIKLAGSLMEMESSILDGCNELGSVVTADEWDVIASSFQPKGRRGRPREHSQKDIVNAILYVLKGGITWRMMPNDLPPWQTVYDHFSCWSKRGVWEAGSSFR